MMCQGVRDIVAVDTVEQQALIRVKPVPQWLSPFLMLQHFSSVPHSGVTPTIKLFPHYFITNFATVMTHNVNIRYAGYLILIPCGRVTAHRLRATAHTALTVTIICSM